MKTRQIWIAAARPKTLAAGISPVLLGSALALSKGFFNPLIFVMTLLTALGIQITTNFANDYFDFIKGADTEKRKGPLRVMQAGLVSSSTMKKVIFITLASTACLGSYLAFQGGIVILLLLSLSLVLAILYTGGPYPIAYLGLGDLFVLIFFGPVAVGGTYFLQTGSFSVESLLAGLGIGLISAEVLSINNLRDVEEDAAANKKTLIVRFGKPFGKIKYILSLSFATFIPLFFPSHPFTLLTWLFLIPAIPCIRQVLSTEDPTLLNRTLAKTGQLVLIYAVLFSIGLLIR